MRKPLAVLVLLGMLAVVGTGLGRTWTSLDRLSGPALRHVTEGQSARFACLERSLRAQIPLGSAVVNQATSALDRQRIIEELTPGYRFVTALQPGAYLVAFRHHGSCGGQSAKVTHVP